MLLLFLKIIFTFILFSRDYKQANYKIYLEMDWENIPYYLFFIVRPDGNSAYYRVHERYPLEIKIDQLLGLVSLSFSMNNLQTNVVPQEIIANRKQEIDLSHRNFIKSMVTSTFQIRCYDSVSGYRFVLMVNSNTDPKKIDSKLEEIYKVFVNYVIKAPFFNREQTIESSTFKKKSDEILYK